jgi:hypothetical protein
LRYAAGDRSAQQYRNRQESEPSRHDMGGPANGRRGRRTRRSFRNADMIAHGSGAASPPGSVDDHRVGAWGRVKGATSPACRASVTSDRRGGPAWTNRRITQAVRTDRVAHARHEFA